MSLWDSFTSSVSDYWNNNSIGSILGDVSGVAGTAWDIYSGYQNQQLSNQYANLAFASAQKQDEYAQAMWDRYKEKYWPLEDLNIQYTMEDMQTLRPAYANQVNYQAQRLNEQLAQAQYLNPILDDTEKSLIRKLVEGEDVLADRYMSQATADVGAAYGSQREQDMRAMGLAGINPNSGQMMNYMSNMGRSQALSEATARTQAARQAEDTAISRQSQALNYAKGATLPTYQVTPSVSTSGISSTLGSLSPSYTGLANMYNTNAQNSWNGANVLLNRQTNGQYGNVKRSEP